MARLPCNFDCESSCKDKVIVAKAKAPHTPRGGDVAWDKETRSKAVENLCALPLAQIGDQYRVIQQDCEL